MKALILILAFAILLFLIGMVFRALKFLIVVALVLVVIAMVMRSIQKTRRENSS